MYMKRMLEIGQAENGYVVEVRVHFKPKKKKERDEMVCEYHGSNEKQFIAKDLAELNTIVAKIMPMLDEEFSSEEEFDAAFEKAAE